MTFRQQFNLVETGISLLFDFVILELIHSILFNGGVILHCVYVPQLSYPFICITLYTRQQKRR